MLKRIINKNLITIILTVLLLLGLYLISIKIPQEAIRSFIDSFGPFGPAVFIITMLLTFIFAPLSGSPLLFVGFLLFGRNVIWYTMVSALLASITNFWIARVWGRPLIGKFVGEENIKKIDKLSQNYGLGMLFILRIFQGGIGEFVSYAAGLTSIKFTSYILVSTLGMIPGTVIWYLLSSIISSPLEFTILSTFMAFIFSIIFIISTLIIKKLKS